MDSIGPEGAVHTMRGKPQTRVPDRYDKSSHRPLSRSTRDSPYRNKIYIKSVTANVWALVAVVPNLYRKFPFPDILRGK